MHISILYFKKMLEIKNCHEYIYVHDLDFPLMRERERGRERELPRWPMLFVSMHLSMCL